MFYFIMIRFLPNQASVQSKHASKQNTLIVLIGWKKIINSFITHILYIYDENDLNEISSQSTRINQLI